LLPTIAIVYDLLRKKISNWRLWFWYWYWR